MILCRQASGRLDFDADSNRAAFKAGARFVPAAYIHTNVLSLIPTDLQFFGRKDMKTVFAEPTMFDIGYSNVTAIDRSVCVLSGSQRTINVVKEQMNAATISRCAK